MPKIVDAEERNINQIQPGDKVLTGLFWETVDRRDHKAFDMKGNVVSYADPTAFWCNGHLVERQCILKIAFVYQT